MNSLGRMFRFHIMGESHGKIVGALLDGCPAGIPLSEDDFSADLGRRRAGALGTTPRLESDIPRLITGILEGKTTGAPLLVLFDNANTDSRSYLPYRNLPRPGHADLVARQKFGGFNDWRGGGHFSARLTVALVAGGVVAKKLLPGIRIEAKLMELGGSTDLAQAVELAEREHDSLGGVVECQVTGLPAGLGEPFFDSVESLLAHAAFSIPAVKGIEFGDGFSAARQRGSQYADAIVDCQGRTATNHAGGINGGLANGNPIVFRVAMRPASGSARQLNTVDLSTGQAAVMAPGGRHDRCIPLRAPVVLEAMTAMVLADLMLLEQRVTRVARDGAPS